MNQPITPWQTVVDFNSCESFNELKSIVENLKKHELPNTYPKNLIERSFDFLAYRDKVIELAGFPLITKEFCNALATWINGRKCLEVMSGCGALAKGLIDNGVSIIATDNKSWYDQDWFIRSWCNVLTMDAVRAVEIYGKDSEVIIMSWPYMDNTAASILRTVRKVNPNAVMIYIGESNGGCCADDDFFDIVEYIEDQEFEDSVSELLPRWCGLHDKVYLIK